MSGHVLAGMTVIIPMGELTAFGWKSTYWYMGKNPPCHQRLYIFILIDTLLALQIADFKEGDNGKTLFHYFVTMLSQDLFVFHLLGDVILGDWGTSLN